ncbi:MAG: GntP family permease [Actinomycetota bacterium]
MDSTWTTIGIILAGVVVVVGGILALRLHAFLALVLGALLVGALTPSASVERHALQKDRVSVAAVDAASSEARLKLTRKQGALPGMVYLIARPGAGGRLESVGELQIDRFEEAAGGELAVARPRGEASLPQPGDVVIHPFALRSARSAASKNVAERVATGFGNTCASIGILIALASIIGKCLLESGVADRVVRSALRVLGERGAPLAFMFSGFLLAVPVFFDTVFYLMIPLGKAMGMRQPRSYLLFVLTIVAGGTMAHSLVPPTPGPLFVAEQLGVDLGTMIIAGSIVGLFTSTAGYFIAQYMNRRSELPLRDSVDLSLADLQTLSQRGDHELPPTWLSLLPILLPVVILGGAAVMEASGWKLEGIGALVSDKNIALLLSAVIAMGTLAWKKRVSRVEMAKSTQSALLSAGEIILITAAGGAFGAVLQQTGVAGLISDLPRSSPAVILTLAFLITTAIRTAQGSATVAMITAVGVLSGIAGQGLGFHPVYLALAIGCGSKPIAWMNDSGFWVITKMSGMTEREGLKYITPMTSLMGVVGLLVLLVAVTFLPMR